MARKKKTLEAQIKQGLTDLAFGDISDAVSLLYLDDEQALENLKRLNLFNISEIKKQKGGGMEIKFFDRSKALEKLGQLTTLKSDEGLGFFQALEKSALELREKEND